MRTPLAILSLLLFAHFACSDRDDDISPVRDDASIVTLNGTWRVVSYENYNDNSVELKNQANSMGLEIVISFDDTIVPHVLSGTNTTNTVSGEFEYLSDRRIKINSYISTEVAQPAWGNKFNEAISSGELDYRINARQLRMYYDNKSRSVTLLRE